MHEATGTVDQDPPKENIGLWIKRLKDSEKVMREKFKPKYDLARKRLRSEYEIITQKKNLPTHSQVNLVYSIGTNFIHSVHNKNPDINLRARNEQESDAVENTEVKINDFLKNVNAKRTVKRQLWDGYLGGFWAGYTDYEYSDVDTGEPMTTEGGEPVLDEQGQPVNRREVVKNGLVFKRIRPDLVRFPKGFDFDCAEDSPWVGFEIIVPLEDAKNDDSFDPNVRERLKGSHYDKLSSETENTFNRESSDNLYVKTCYVFKKPQAPGQPYQRMVLASEIEDAPLIPLQPFDKGHTGYPIKFGYFNPIDDDEPYPNGDPWIWESQLNAVDRWWKSMVNRVRRINNKIIYDKRVITKQEIQRLKSNEDEEYAGIGEANKNQRPIGDLIFKFQHDPLPKDFFDLLSYSEQTLDKMAPKSALTQGEGKATDTATEAQIIQANETVDLDARVDVIREYMKDIVLDMAGLLERNTVGVVDIQGTTSGGKEISRTAGADGFTSRVDVDVDVDSMRKINREIYRRQLMDEIMLYKNLEPELNKKGKSVDFEFYIKKLSEESNIRNAEQAIVELNVRDASKEHEDLAFDGIPFQVQKGEDLEKHLVEHYQVFNNTAKMTEYERMQPGFAEQLAEHIKQTSMALQSQKQTGEKPPISGTRQPFATEAGRR